jgi:hypothetical protein
MRSRYYNPADFQERENIQAAIDLGHTIVCTSRPLPGETAWIGEWCGGIHWATGNLEQYRKSWTDLDAAIIVLVDNSKLLEIAKENYLEKYQDPDYKNFYPSWEEAIQKYDRERLVEMLVPNAPSFLLVLKNEAPQFSAIFWWIKIEKA